ncbi:type III-B CRISPR module RAMP protein Cmr6 [Clostridium sp. MSJ-4]|uniref:Type III-B CRISPR module RAMP protein Cmr6 n=1 Tax=Clostridium simiarum TaxID=2841506 RepID=A0ABS6F4A7_9CLOT|nr:type III-B CRISPR module RAMP protein Cmr6 [Clostridium simiarum]MBU5593308.1 type III-B CRISPR module RAMP protein Cmr6 [Clostridium simiarum]
MSIGNLGYLYYKEYYDKFINEYKTSENISDKEKNEYFIEKNSEIIADSTIYKNSEIIEDIETNLYTHKLYFKTTYPGLLIGTGYSHIIKEKEAFKLGLEFDYTTGLPIINGSSVKGMLRSVFYIKDDSEELKEEKKTYIKNILKELKIENDYLDKMDFEALTYSIFEGKYKDKDDIYKSIPLDKRDIFFGATIDINKTMKEKTDKDKYLLGEDYITPHGTGEEKLKNPNPIKFLKVMPNVVWCFGFDLKDLYNLEDKKTVITKDIKQKMFNNIILDLGIGAKTNVGYGRFDEKYHVK